MPAVNTPSAITGNDFFTCMSKASATNAPVHAPVPGRGIATKRYNPHFAYKKTQSLMTDISS